MIDSIYKLYPQVVRTVGDEAFDIDGNLVEIDQAKIEAYEQSIDYIAQRAPLYPPIQVLADGLAKQSSTDPVMKAEGDAQVAKYYADCLAVKNEFPKEQV